MRSQTWAKLSNPLVQNINNSNSRFESIAPIGNTDIDSPSNKTKSSVSWRVILGFFLIKLAIFVIDFRILPASCSNPSERSHTPPPVFQTPKLPLSSTRSEFHKGQLGLGNQIATGHVAFLHRPPQLQTVHDALLIAWRPSLGLAKPRPWKQYERVNRYYRTKERELDLNYQKLGSLIN